MSKEEKIIEMKQKHDLNGLVKIIKNDAEWMFRMDAAEALARLGDKRGLNYLIHSLDDSDTDVRDVAKEILEGLNDPRGNQALLRPRKLGTVHSEHDSSSENRNCSHRGTRLKQERQDWRAHQLHQFLKGVLAVTFGSIEDSG